ncbi:MAG: helix-turn-helix domain-containing protein [Firmicutes bacterium]|nr:helix-turn-helix domain-containing protein [Bacillota bacterium]
MNRITRQLNPYIIESGCLDERKNYFPAGYEFFPRNARFYEIQFITGGAGKLIIEGQHYETRKGDLFFIKPGMQVQGIAGYFSYNLGFDPVYSESREHCYHSNIPFWASDNQTRLPDSDFFDDLPYQYHTSRFDEFEPLFSGIHQRFLNDRQANQPYMKLLLLQIINLIYEDLDSHPSRFRRNRINDQYYQRVMNSKRFIDNNLGAKLTLDNLARQFGTSPTFFSKLFKKIMGITPFEYINESRLTKAHKLLTTTYLSIKEVASLCGFENLSYFYRLFKQRFDITPVLFSEGYQNRVRTLDVKRAGDKTDAGAMSQFEAAFFGETKPTGAVTGKRVGGHNPELLPLDPYIIGCAFDSQPDYVFPVGVKMVPRVSRYYEIELIIGGAGMEITDGRHFNASRGDIFFRRPGMLIQGISGYYFYEIAFDPVFCESRKSYYESPTPFFLPEPETTLPDQGFLADFPYKYHTARLAELESLFTNVYNSFCSRKENWRLEANRNLLKILSIVAEELRTQPSIIHEKQAIDSNYDKIMACKSWIDNHLEHKFSLETLADICCVSRNFFYKIFKQVVGTTPIKYINEARLRMATTLLANTRLSIEEISARCGFEYTGYFYRLFKRRFKMTPSCFRQQSNLFRQDC